MRDFANRDQMLTPTDAKARGLADLPPVASDSLLALIALANADPRPDKIDVGVGVFRDAAGNTPILKVMKEAEQRLLDTQVTKGKVEMAVHYGLTDEEVAEGYVLTCQSVPLGDGVAVDYDA